MLETYQVLYHGRVCTTDVEVLSFPVSILLIVENPAWRFLHAEYSDSVYLGYP